MLSAIQLISLAN